MSVNYKIGDLAAKYETPNKDPGYISNGEAWKDPGGTSYGSYQLESKLGTLQAYLKTKDKFTTALQGLKINSEAFKAKWRQLAKEDPQGFQQSQFNYLHNKPNGSRDALNFATSLGWDVACFALQSAIFSTANQSGGWKKILTNAHKKPHYTVREQINALYDARAEYFQSLTSLTPQIKRSIIKARTVDERRDCLKLL